MPLQISDFFLLGSLGKLVVEDTPDQANILLLIIIPHLHQRCADHCGCLQGQGGVAQAQRRQLASSNITHIYQLIVMSENRGKIGGEELTKSQRFIKASGCNFKKENPLYQALC